MSKYDPNIAVVIEDAEAFVPEEVRGLVSKLSLQNPVSNLGEDYLFFKDSSVFSPAANAFRRHRDKGNPCYTTALEGTSQYQKYWVEEKKRCMNGYTVGGVYRYGS